MYCLVKPFSSSQIHYQQLILTLLPPIQAEYRFFPLVLVGDRTKILEYLNHQDQETTLIYIHALYNTRYCQSLYLISVQEKESQLPNLETVQIYLGLLHC